MIADYDSDGKVVGFTIEHAVELLRHPLARKGGDLEHIEIQGMYAGYSYTLLLSNGTRPLAAIESKFAPVKLQSISRHIMTRMAMRQVSRWSAHRNCYCLF